jgi:hypothetical protein
MARPRRSEAERLAIAEALDAMPSSLSNSAKAKRLGHLVAAELIAQAIQTDPLGDALFRLRAAVDNGPVFRLAFDPEIDLHSKLEKLRVDRFTARGCGWLDQAGWEQETREIEQQLAKCLAARFRR